MFRLAYTDSERKLIPVRHDQSGIHDPWVQAGRLIELRVGDAIQPQRLIAGQRSLGRGIAGEHAV